MSMEKNLSSKEQVPSINQLIKALETYCQQVDPVLSADPDQVFFKADTKSHSWCDDDGGHRFEIHTTYYCQIEGKQYEIAKEDYPSDEMVYQRLSGIKEFRDSATYPKETAERVVRWQWFTNKILGHIESKVAELQELASGKDVLARFCQLKETLLSRQQERQRQISKEGLQASLRPFLDDLERCSNELYEQIKFFRYLPTDLESGVADGFNQGGIDQRNFDLYALSEAKNIYGDLLEQAADATRVADPAWQAEAYYRLRQIPERRKHIADCVAAITNWKDKLDKEAEATQKEEVAYHYEGTFDLTYGRIGDVLVITPEGALRASDIVRNTGKVIKGRPEPKGVRIWNKIERGELVVALGRSQDMPVLEVKHAPASGITEPQRAAIQALEVKYGAIPGSFGFDEKKNAERGAAKEQIIKELKEMLDKNIPKWCLLELFKKIEDDNVRIEDLRAAEGVVLATEENLDAWGWQAHVGDKLIDAVKIKLFGITRLAKNLGTIFHGGSVTKNPVFLVSERKSGEDAVQLLVTKYRGKQNLHVRVVASGLVDESASAPESGHEVNWGTFADAFKARQKGKR